MTKIILENNIVHDIPILSIYQSGLKKSPLVFYLHGYGGNREQALDFGYMLAKKGFYYVSIDCKDHGLRKTHNENNKFSKVFPTDTGLDTYVHMHEVIEQSALDIQILIEYFKSRDEIDSSKIGLSGFSMGGYATFYIAANNPNIKVAVPVAGKPAFTKAWEDGILSTSTYAQWRDSIHNAKKEVEKRTAYFQMIDPYEKMSNFSPKPLLVINGDQDTDSPSIYSLELYKKLLPLYAEQPEKLQLSMPFVNHQFNDYMKLEACKWFEKYLGKHSDKKVDEIFNTSDKKGDKILGRKQIIIRDYHSNDEIGWVRCRVLAFLQTAYFDNVLNKKEKYENPAIELVAEIDGVIVGLIDIEYELEEGTVCSRGEGLGGMIWHVAVHPDFSRRGIGSQLLFAAEKKAKELKLNRFEAWTRDDKWVQNWYEKLDFKQVDQYYHVYLDGDELESRVQSNLPEMKLVSAFAHYVGNDMNQFNRKNSRIHECVCYEKYFK